MANKYNPVKGMFIGAGIMIAGGIGQTLTKDFSQSLWKVCFGLWCAGFVYWVSSFIGQLKKDKAKEKNNGEE